MLSRHPPNFLPLAWLPTYPCRYQFLEEQSHTETDGPGTPFLTFEAEHAWRSGRPHTTALELLRL